MRTRAVDHGAGGAGAATVAVEGARLSVAAVGSENAATLFRLERLGGDPGGDGAIRRLRLGTPAFRRAAYFAGAQRYGIDPARVTWPDGCNQLQPLVMDELSNLKEGGLLLLLELVAGGVLAVLPIAGRETVAWLGTGTDGGPSVRVGTLGTARFAGSVDVLAAAWGPEPMAACDAAWRAAMSAPSVRGRVRHRTEKRYPPVFETLGWCSWEAFRADISEAILTDALDALGASRVPVRWALIDDGWLDGRSTRHTDPKLCDDRALTSFGAHPERFPNGLRPVREAAERAGLDWAGLWLNFNGYWEGLHDGHTEDSLRPHLTEVRPGVHQPSPRAVAQRRFYDAMLAPAADSGFDFVKVDNQARSMELYRGSAANAAAAAAGNSEALEAAAASRFDAMINCMAHNNACAFSTAWSAVTRTSEDYLKHDRWRAKMHLYHSFANALYFAPTVWGDHDMFHSSDRVAAGVMARSKALSGGPVYVSDRPEELEARVIEPLALSDGRILRALAPAAPTPDSVFVNPYTGGRAFRAAAPTADGSAAVAAYNLSEPDGRVVGRVERADLAFARSLAGHRAGDTGADRVALYDAGARVALELRDSGYARELGPLEDLFAILAPLENGWAVFGALEKHLSPAACEVRVRARGELVVASSDGLAVSVWAEEPRGVSVHAGRQVEPAARGENILTVEPDSRGVVRLTR